MVRLPTDRPDELVDTCGTGGGSVSTFNISTAAAFVAAGAGARVAKHGNSIVHVAVGQRRRARGARIALDRPLPGDAPRARHAGVVFMFAPLMHPAMRHVGPVRRELAVPTVMNVVGRSPTRRWSGRQVVGSPRLSGCRSSPAALAALGARHALVVHGAPGMDEVSPIGLTEVVEVRDGAEVGGWRIDPRTHGYSPTSTPPTSRAANPRRTPPSSRPSSAGAARGAPGPRSC
jgi:anthranilate phosphoribosyltransferase